MKSKHWLLTLLLCAGVTLASPASHADESVQQQQTPTSAPNCGVVSVLELARVKGLTIPTSVRAEIILANAQSTATLAQVKSMAAKAGIETQGVKTTLQSLLDAQQPAIVHLRAPDHFALLLDGTSQWVRVMESTDNFVSVVPRAEIEKRFSGFALQTTAKELANGPKVNLQESDFHFGVSGVGQKVEHSFRLTNSGQSDLKVSVQSASCSCTVALLGEDSSSSELTLQPNQSSPVRVAVEVRSAGAVQQMVTLATNDPTRPLIYLTMRGTAPQNLVVSPQSLNFQMQQGETRERTINITGLPSLEVLDLTTDVPLVSVTKQLVSRDETRAVWKVNATLSKATVGSNKALLTIKTTHPERPEITVPIAATVRGDLQISPNAAFFGFIKKGERQVVELKVTSQSGQAFQILSAQPPKDVGLKVETPLGRSAPTHTVKVELDSLNPTFIEGQLELQTDSLQEPTLLIPITAYVEDALPSQTQAAQLPRAEDDPDSIIGVARPTMKVSQRAPNFKATDANSKVWNLSALMGKKNVLLTFFPRCFTGGCANHLSSLRDVYPQLQDANVEVLAISVDPAKGDKGQLEFAKQWQLPFPLVPDTKRELSMLYGAAQNDKQLTARMSVLIDKSGIVRWIDTDVQVQTHGADVLAKIGELGIK